MMCSDLCFKNTCLVTGGRAATVKPQRLLMRLITTIQVGRGGRYSCARPDSRYVVERELTALADGLDEGYGEREESEMNPLFRPILFLSLGETVVESFHSCSMCLTLCDSMDCNPTGCSVHGIVPARIMEWDAISYSRGFPTQRLNRLLRLLHCLHLQVDSLPLSHLGNHRRSLSVV